MGSGEVSGTSSVSVNDINSIKHSSAETLTTQHSLSPEERFSFISSPDLTA